MNIFKMLIKYFLCAIMVIVLQSLILTYCLNNIYFSVSAGAKEQAYPEYADKIMGFAGGIRNNTIFPIKIKSIEPFGGRGIEYVTTVITEWGFSEINRGELFEKESLENKVIGPFSEYPIGHFYKFTGEYMVNPDAYEISFSIFGIKLSKIELVGRVH
ncbi:hypothetical protein [Sedimentibacter sp.]|uniref:hypothetical protein n=1 Tax=Sedimentibacter sp. TaxID=1960295 RepID=UPI0028A6EF31|nr:hypothetical protein [Sedimentibacter sp.]